MGGLVSDDSGLLYGVTNYGGATSRGCNGSAGCGTFFTFDPSSRQDTVLYSFGKTLRDGELPNWVVLSNGSFYGTTEDGGTSADLGTVFKITPPARESGEWNETILYRFRGPPNDGSSPSQITIDASWATYGPPITAARREVLHARVPLVGVRDIFSPEAHFRRANAMGRIDPLPLQGRFE
jgi:uncharacterized repeat protein (TIGR03803 family)